jgi:hypothetical protein
MKGLSVLCFAGLIAACFFPWITVESRGLVITGMHAEALNFGKPGLFHIILSAVIIVFLVLGRTWSVRAAFFIGAFNLAWAARNYFSLSACSGGVCPEREPALYLLPVLSVLGVIFLLLIRQNSGRHPVAQP